MKRALLILALLLCAPQSVSAGSLAKAPNNLGLVGYWSFNEGTGLRAGDFSGYGTHGTLTGGPTWAGGKFGGGLNFDGINDRVTIPVTGSYVAKGNLGFASSESFTISLWYKGTDTSGGHVSVGKGLLIIPDGTVYAGLAMFNGYPEFVHYNAGWNHNIRSNVNIADNKWHQVTYVNDNDLGWLYIDGVAVVSGASSVIETGKYFQPSTVAAGYNAQYTSGSFDEVRIYNRALGANEVARMYAGSGASKIQSAQSEAGTGLVGHWKLDDRAGTRATDSSGRGNHGTLTGFNFTGATSNWISGRLGGGLVFDGTNDYVDFGASNTLNVYQNATFTLWFRQLGDAGGSYQPFIQRFGAAVTGYQIFSYNSNDTICFYTSSIVCSTYVIGDSDWHHLAITNDGTTTRFYVDGVARGSATQSGVNITTATVNTIGNYAGNYFNGSLDDVRIYNRALTAEQIKTLYASGTARPAIANANSASLTAGTNLASGLVGHWSFDGKYLSPTTARDTSGQGNDGTLTNGPAVAIGKMGQALSFDGVNDYISNGDPASLRLTSALTVSAWAKSDGANDDIIVHELSNYGISKGFTSIGATSNKFNFNLYKSSAWNIVNSTTTPTANTWYHVVGTYDGTNGRIYVNGVLEGTSGVVLAPLDTGSGSIIGGYSGGFFFSGSIDDVRIYNRALSATEVKQLYYLGK